MVQFTTQYIATDSATIFTQYGGSGPAILLLHGFPETHHMWRSIAPLLAQNFTVIMADLRGYGDSSCPQSTEDHAPYSKRAMALDMIQVMQQLGFSQFAVVGHDRGARVAYRMALDYPNSVSRLVVLDVLPIDIAWNMVNADMMLGYWPWSLLAQPVPLPERMLEATAAEIVNNACDSWGSAATTFSAETRKTYTKALTDPEHIHAICEEYRAAATIDREHDEADQKSGHVITCPTLLLWAADGALDIWYQEQGGPLALWKAIAPHIQGEAIRGGHFFAEEMPEVLHQKLIHFIEPIPPTQNKPSGQ
jgi:haloacetate dehalogenase